MSLPKLEYGDFHKFLVSLGAILLALVPFIYWLFLQVKLEFDNEAYLKLSGLTKDLAEKKYALLLITYRILPWLSFVLSIFAIGLIAWGGIRWRQKQVIIDATAETGLENQKLGNEEIRKRLNCNSFYFI